MFDAAIFTVSVDNNGRFKVPSNLRDCMKGRLVLLRCPYSSTCIYGYNEAQWDEFWDSVNEKVPNSEEGDRQKRKILSTAIIGDVDKSDRFTIKSEAREYLNMENSLCIVKGDKHFELWSPEAWQEEQERFSDTSLANLGIAF